MGSLTPRESLWLEVQRTAALAATADPRFAPVTADELPDMAIEISVLGPLERVTDVSQIEIGVHGLFLLHGMRRGTLLPQVASDRGWSRDEFLLQLCRKAGLPDSAWRSGELYRFTADSFGDRGGAESR